VNLPLPNCFTSSIKTARNDPVSSRSYISSNLRLKQLPFFTFLFMGWGGVWSYLLSLSSRFFPVFTMTCFPFTPPKRVHPISIPSPSGPARMGLGCWYSKTECLLSGSRCWQRWDPTEGRRSTVRPPKARPEPPFQSTAGTWSVVAAPRAAGGRMRFPIATERPSPHPANSPERLPRPPESPPSSPAPLAMGGVTRLLAASPGTREVATSQSIA
jgi:hypothetical protein